MPPPPMIKLGIAPWLRRSLEGEVEDGVFEDFDGAGHIFSGRLLRHVHFEVRFEGQEQMAFGVVAGFGEKRTVREEGRVSDDGFEVRYWPLAVVVHGADAPPRRMLRTFDDSLIRDLAVDELGAPGEAFPQARLR